MDEPRRILDGSGTDLERVLLEEVRSYRASAEMRKRTFAALAVTGSASLTLAGVIGWAKTSTAKLLLGLCAASALLVPLGYFWSRHHATSPRPSAVTARLDVPPQLSPQAPIEDTLASSGASAGVPSVVAHPPAAVRHFPKRNATARTASSPRLRAEIAALDAVRGSLSRSDFPGSLSLLDDYFKTFGRGRLRLEAQMLRIEALARGGQSEEARAEAKEFLRRNPRSVHAARLQSLVDD